MLTKHSQTSRMPLSHRQTIQYLRIDQTAKTPSEIMRVKLKY